MHKVKFPYSVLLAGCLMCCTMAVAMTYIYCQYQIKVEQIKGRK